MKTYNEFTSIRPGLSAFAQWAEDHDGTFIPAKGNGSCGYNSISIRLFGNDKKHNILRAQSVEIQKSYEKSIFCRLNEREQKELNKVIGTAATRRFLKSQPDAWFDSDDAMALSIKYNVKIVILGLNTETNEVLQTFPTKSMESILRAYTPQTIIYMFHHTTKGGARDHFDVFIPNHCSNVIDDDDYDLWAKAWEQAVTVNI